jgi:hypothetical protein
LLITLQEVGNRRWSEKALNRNKVKVVLKPEHNPRDLQPLRLIRPQGTTKAVGLELKPRAVTIQENVLTKPNNGQHPLQLSRLQKVLHAVWETPQLLSQGIWDV